MPATIGRDLSKVLSPEAFAIIQHATSFCIRVTPGSVVQLQLSLPFDSNDPRHAELLELMIQLGAREYAASRTKISASGFVDGTMRAIGN